MATKRKTADQAQDTTTTDAGIATLAEQLPAATPVADTTSQTAAAARQEPPLGSDGKYHTMREPGVEPEKSWVKKASVIVDPEAGVKFSFDSTS